MFAIFKREFRAYFTSPLGYVFLAIFYAFSGLFFYAIGVAVMPVYGFVMSTFAKVSWLPIWGNTVGLLLLGGIFVSIGLFVSSLTENQMIAAIGSFFINLMILLMNTLTSALPTGFLQDVLSSISVYSRYSQITNGIFSLSSLIFFVSVIFIFLFLTVRVLEKRRWA